MLNQRLQQKLIQKLSPQQIQMIKLLEIPTMQLEERIKEELEENPLLEEGRDETGDAGDTGDTEQQQGDDHTDLSIDEYLADDTPLYKLSAKNFNKEEQKTEIPFSAGSSFHDQLVSQLGLRNISEREYMLAEYLIGNIDDDGYMRRKVDAVADDLAFSMGVETNEEELKLALKIIQEFDPPGVGARNLNECLMLQLNQKEQTPEIEMAKTILISYFDEFTKKHYDKIISKLDISEDDLKSGVDEILKLNPKPGGSFQSDKIAEHIIPDFLLDYKDNGTLQLSLNSRNVPELRVSRMYSDMLDTYSKNKKNKQTREAVSFVKQKLDSAKWFIDAIKQRQTTLMQTMEAIIAHQREYFMNWGDELMLNPMILKDIADATGLDISTVSRVANSKYIQTPFGMYPLKFFFSEGLETISGDEVSTREIKKILQDCVDGESKRKPLTDDELAEILQEKGYLIARRTIAKYREHLNIPVARLRKEL